MRLAILALIGCASLAAATVKTDVEFARKGEVRLLLDASVPEGKGPFPAVIIVHGGGFVRGNRLTYVPPMFQPLTAANFTWFTIEYRLAPTVNLEQMSSDVVSAIEWVHRHAAEYKVDPKRVALLGESAGAYLVDYAAMTVSKEFPVAAVVSFYGPHDFGLQAQKRGVSEGLRGLTGVTELNAEGEKKLRDVSPYYMIKPGLPPFLLLHGTADEQVAYEQSPRFCEALKAKGVPCELYTLPGGKHGMGSWEQRADLQGYKAKVVDWLKKTLGAGN